MSTTQTTRRRVHNSSTDASETRAPTVSPVWSWLRDHPVALLIVPASVGLGLGLLMPRGPATTTAAGATVLTAFVVGAISGRGWRSAWAYLAVPLTLAVAYEIARVPVTGPSVDVPSTASLFGSLALLGGRGFLALVAGLPTVLGVALGRNLPTEGSTGRLTWRTGRAATALLLVAALAVVVGRPASTEPIRGADGQVLADSIAELSSVEINGHDLGVMVRGHDVDNPVLLFLAGGPGGTELGAMRRHLESLERHATVVTWDQRGTGRSYGALDPVDTYTLQSAIDDTVAMTEYLRDRFDKDRIYLVGQSWGATLGVMTVQQRPDLYHAYVGVGQMVSQTATDRIGYEDTITWARNQGHEALATDLVEQGPPPYTDVSRYEAALSHEPDVYAYDHSGNAEGAGGFSENLLVPEYSVVDLFHVFPGFLDTASVLYPQLADVDFRDDVTEVQVPVHFVQGAHETRGRTELFAEWYPMLEAPEKDLVVFERSGHRPMFEQPERFTDYMVDRVLAVTADR